MKRFTVLPFLLLLGSSTITSVGFVVAPQITSRGFTQELRIASDDRNPATSLTAASDLIVSAKGLHFTAHTREGIVRVFDGDGKYLRSIGRKGEGPGEFGRSFSLLAAVGDTVIVHDTDRWSLVFFLDNGRYLRTVDLQTFGDPARRPLPVSYLGNDRIFAEVNYFAPRGSSTANDSTVFWMAETSGKLIQRLGVYSIKPTVQPRPGAGLTDPEATVAGLYVLRPRYLRADGGRGILIYPSDVFGGTRDQFKVLTINKDGIASERVYTMPARTLSTRDIDDLTALTTKSIVDNYKTVMRASGGQSQLPPPPADAEATVRRTIVRMGTPPPMQVAVAGADGSLWVMSMRHRLDWTVFDPAGRLLYTVRIPVEMRVMRVTVDRFWAITPDSDGLPVITRNRVAAR